MSMILIIGASQGIGLQTTEEALNRGYAVRAMSRSADKMSLRHNNLELKNGSALSEEDVTSALAGVSCVIVTLGVALRLDTIARPVRLFSQATRVIVPAMEKAGVKRIICVTGYGTGNSRSTLSLFERIPFQLVFRHIYDDKGIQEQIIRGSQLDWVIARPGVLTGGSKTSRYKTLVEREHWKNGLISRANVADFLVKQIGSDDYLRKTPVLIG